MSQARELASEKMHRAGLSDYEINSFLRAYGRLTSGEQALIPESDIDAIEAIAHASQLHDVSPDALARTAVLKLNGGIGTTMGLTCPKSVLEAHGGQSFLEITARQILATRARLGVELPFILLNSPSTHEATMDALSDFHLHVDGLPLAVVQSVFPRINAHTLQPISWPQDPTQEWAPPGHGDLYGVLDRTGLLDQLLDRGYEYLFVSNIDNTGAVLSEEIATWFADSDAPFAAEVARRSPMDMKGGHFARRRSDGQIILREVAQCPKDDEECFRNIELHQYMNTNNLWINLPALRAKLDTQSFDLALIVNRKRIDPKNPASPEIIQLESAMGSAVALFEGSQILEVGRERFVPVKSTADLLLLRSDVFDFDNDNRLVQQTRSRPTVSLDEKFFKRYDQFEARVQDVPSLRHARSLTVKGDVSIPESYVAQG
ncbi:MAG: UTP--glucose-1-phosphate uridylyltransferase, partial [Actinomycetaceae bacterium]|nr:UTP--glucose-1-phosphate uridylyltransferase [Actinomycetaceae bacterium]